MSPILSAVVAVLAFFLIGWIVSAIKAAKDPDVQAASNLMMSITHYRAYQRFWNEYMEVKNKYGAYSKETDAKIKEILKQIRRPNEWLRFVEYMDKKEGGEE